MEQSPYDTVKANKYGYTQVDLDHIHRLYKKSDLLQTEPLNKKEFRQVVEFIMKRVWYYMFSSMWIYRLPYKLGKIMIIENDSNWCSTFTNWKKCREQKKEKRSYNMHSNGRKFGIYWDRILVRSRNVKIFMFRPYRGVGKDYTGKRGLAAWIKMCANDPFKKDFRGYQLSTTR